MYDINVRPVITLICNNCEPETHHVITFEEFDRFSNFLVFSIVNLHYITAQEIVKLIDISKPLYMYCFNNDYIVRNGQSVNSTFRLTSTGSRALADLNTKIEKWKQENKEQYN